MNGTSWLPDSFEDWSFSRAKGKLTDMTALQQAHPDNIYTVTDNSLQASTSRCDEVAIVPGSGGVHLCLVQESYAQFGLTGPLPLRPCSRQSRSEGRGYLLRPVL
jgi:hypothetical protein